MKINHIYKVIWNVSLGIWVAVSEIARGNKKTKVGTVIKTISIITFSSNAFAGYEASDNGTATTSINCTTTATASVNTNTLTGGAKSTNSLALGNTACAPTTSSIAIGSNSSTFNPTNSASNQSIAIGAESWASGDQAISLGANTRASGNSSIAIGGDDVRQVVNGIDAKSGKTIGALYAALTGDTLNPNDFTPTTASGGASMALGMQNQASGAFATAMGTRSLASGLASIALGTHTQALGDGSLAFGATAIANGYRTIALGSNTNVNGDYSVAIGGDTSVLAKQGVAIGAGSTVNHNGGVAIGYQSVENTLAGVAGYNPNSTTLTTPAWQSTAAALAVGDVSNGITRQITGVAAGSADTDAVNVAQLKATQNMTNTAQATVNKGIKFGNGGGANQYALGDTINVKGDSNVTSTTTTDGVQLGLAKNISVDSINAGGSKLDSNGLSFVDNTGAALANSPVISAAGINAGNQKITNVKAGDITATSTDAINGSQLYNTANNVKNIMGGATTIDATTGAVTTTNIGGTGQSTVNDAIQSVNTTAKAAKTEVKAGDNIDVTSAVDGTDGHTTYTVTTAKQVAFDKVSVGNVVIDKNSNDIQGLSNTTLGGTGFATSGRAATEEQLNSTQGNLANLLGGNATNNGGTVSMSNIGGTGKNTVDDAIASVKTTTDKGINFGDGTSSNNYKLGNTINVKGDSNVTSTTTADGVQLGLAKNISVDSINAGGSKLDSNGLSFVDNTGAALANSPVISAVGINAGNKKITNVKAGDITATSTDAVNGGQLYNTIDSIKNIMGGAATVDGTTRAVTTTNIGGTGQSTVNDAIQSVNTTAKAAKTEVKAGDNIDVTSAVDGTDGHTTYTVTTAKQVAFDKVSVGNVVIDKNSNDIQGLSNTTLGGTGFATSGRAATEEQLNATQGNLANLLGGNATNNGGTVSMSNIGGTGQSTVNDAIQSVNTTAKAAKTEVKAGDNIDVTSAVDGTDGHTTYTVTTAKQVAFDKVSVGNVVIDKNSNDIQGLSNTTLGGTGFATSGRAATEEQLNSTQGNLANLLGGNATNSGGTVSMSNIGGTGKNTVDDAIASVKTTTDKGINFGDGTSNHNYKLGDTINVKGDSNVTSTTTTDGVQLGLAKNISVDSINAGGSKLDSNGLSFVDNTGAALANSPVISATGINAGNQKISNVANGVNANDAVNMSQLNTSTASAKTEVRAASGDQNVAVASQTAQDGHMIYSVGVNRALNLDSITLPSTTGNATQLTADGLHFTDQNGNATGPSLSVNGVDAGNEKVTHVQAGDVSQNSTDAINGSQLYGLGQNITGLLGGNALYLGNQITWTNIGGTGQNTINDAIQYVNSMATSANQGWTVATDHGATSTVKPGDTVNINGNQANGITVSNVGNTVTVGLSDKVNIGNKVSIDGTTGTINAGKVTINGNTGTVNGLSNTTWNGPNNIVSGQAATEDQLAQVAQNATSSANAAKTELKQGDNIVVTSAKDTTDGHTVYTVATAKDVNFNSVASNTVKTNSLAVGQVNIDQNGINAGGQKVTNVATGHVSSTSTDAVNGSQLYTTNSNMATYLGGGSTVDANGTTTAPTYNVANSSYNNVGDALGAVDKRVSNVQNNLDQAFTYTNNRINKLEDKLSAGIAATAALEQAPFVAGKWTYAAGASYYNNQSALGATLRRTADNGRWSLTGGVAGGTTGSPLFRVGISGVID
ncbi:ESPR-type extended signal peptide-containing protein [Acinetobacter sp.]|uniref:ESPR-type extended signal peptide-containing protein n=1 Tax=Acinetobacter sp. TaxID=472 RepID=UPI0031E193E2